MAATPVHIRPEREAECRAIHDLVKTAFETAKVRDGDEQDYVDRLRASGNYIPGLALVAECGGGLAGHIMLTRTKLVTDDGRAVRALLLAPLSVLAEHRGRGVGGALVREALRRAGEMGHDAVFLAGDIGYYCRFGFRRAAEFGIEYTGRIPPEFVLAYELRPGAVALGSITIEKT